MLFSSKVEGHSNLPSQGAVSAAGGVIGAISAIVGIGGGTLTVPYLAWHKVPMVNAVATSSAVGLPIAVAGGPKKSSTSEPLGQLMADVLEEEFNQPVNWVETTSENTAQNAINLRAILPGKDIILVTHSLHMKRAIDIFKKVGFMAVSFIPANRNTRVIIGTTVINITIEMNFRIIFPPQLF